MAENAGQSADSLRIRKLNITAPPVLVGAVGNPSFIQKSVIDQAVNLQGQCGEGGDGSFSWLLKFDTANRELTTGGAPPSTDPFNLGYCFVNADLSGLPVQPVTAPIAQNMDGSWSTTTVVPKLYVPIYVHGSLTNVVTLPLTKATIQNVTLSAGGDCVGSYNPDGVTPDQGGTTGCLDQDPSSCQRWHTAGALGGFITLNEADGVFVQDLTRSLCVVLTGGTSLAPDGQHCGRDANNNVTAKGDFCSQTDQAGGCQDSFWLAATFAASAAKINDGSSDSACNGSQKTTDAGTEGGLGPDAGPEGGDGLDAGDASSKAGDATGE